MKTKLLLTAVILFLLSSFHIYSQIDVTSGGGGTLTGVGQSYNESRAMDATVISSAPLHISSMTIRYLNSGADNTIMLGARVFNTSTTALLYSHDTTLNGSMINATVTMPVSYNLNPGLTYRIGFFCGGPNQDNTAGMYQPTFPYNESNNVLQINAGKESASDTYPNNMNIFIPVMTLTYTLTTGFNELETTESTIDFFPNPFTDKVIVGGSTIEEMEVSMYDVCSRKIMEQKINGGTAINTNELVKGIYFYQLKNKSGQIKTGKLVKE